MRASACVILLFVSLPAAAQNVPRPGLIAPDEGSVVYVGEPLVVETSTPSTDFAVTVTNHAQPNSPLPPTNGGVSITAGTGLVVNAASLGARFSSVGGLGIAVTSAFTAVTANCVRSPCTALTASVADAGTGIIGTGGIGVVGIARSSRQQPNPLAGLFSGNVRITGDLYTEGSVVSPQITAMAAEIQSLTSRVAALEAYITGGGDAPGRIEAENYDAGGQGVGYYDSTPGNEGGAYKSDDVDIKPSRDGGHAVGWMTAGEWLNYTFTTGSGEFRLQARLGSALPGRTFRVEVDGAVVTGAIPVPQTAEWDQYVTLELGTVTLNTGPHVIRFVVGDVDYLDLQWIAVTRNE